MDLSIEELGEYWEKQYGHLVCNSDETRTRRSWGKMIARCSDPNDSRYKDYGRRGITVCERWKIFADFLADMGLRPEGKSIDRIDNNAGYHPGNCKWSTPLEQANNRRNSRLLTYNGRQLTHSQWAREIGVDVSTIRSRTNLGQTIDQILRPPSRGARSKTQEQTQ